MRRAWLLAVLIGCGDNHGGGSDAGADAAAEGPPPTAIQFGDLGPLVGDAGKDHFRFGVATAATQIEDLNTATDWYLWTQPAADGGLGKGTFVGDATRGYTDVDTDLQLVHDLGVDSYRFSIEWARIEPVKDQIDEDAIAHYRAELESLHAMGIRPLVTLHHFSNPVWVADPRHTACTGGPSDTNLCGLGGPGGAQVIAQMAEHAGLIASRFGDLVDEWGTLNEPVNYLLAAYGTGTFPPGEVTISHVQDQFIPVMRDYIAAHAAMYDAIKANDTIDADGDGNPAEVGLSMSVADWEPARYGMLSTNPDDLAARDRLLYLFHYLFVDSIVNGTFDGDFDGTPDEQHPDWAGKLDWLGLQYYFRAGVTGASTLIPVANLTPCFNGFDLGACVPPKDPTYCVPQMGYEGWSGGIHDILAAYAARYPAMPLVVTEAGIATDTGARRAENIVRVLEAIAQARDEGVDVRGYYHWSLTDNFEWAMGFAPHFGLNSVNYTTYARTPTEGATVYAAITAARGLSVDLREQYGGNGPMTPDPQYVPSAKCEMAQ